MLDIFYNKYVLLLKLENTTVIYILNKKKKTPN